MVWNLRSDAAVARNFDGGRRHAIACFPGLSRTFSSIQVDTYTRGSDATTTDKVRRLGSGWLDGTVR